MVHAKDLIFSKKMAEQFTTMSSDLAGEVGAEGLLEAGAARGDAAAEAREAGVGVRLELLALGEALGEGTSALEAELKVAVAVLTARPPKKRTVRRWTHRPIT